MSNKFEGHSSDINAPGHQVTLVTAGNNWSATNDDLPRGFFVIASGNVACTLDTRGGGSATSVTLPVTSNPQAPAPLRLRSIVGASTTVNVYLVW